MFVEHIFYFSETTAEISMKFGSCKHLNKVSQVCSNQLCMTCFHHMNLLIIIIAK